MARVDLRIDRELQNLPARLADLHGTQYRLALAGEATERQMQTLIGDLARLHSDLLSLRDLIGKETMALWILGALHLALAVGILTTLVAHALVR